MKSAYEAALERLDQQGIERPKSDALSDDIRQEMAAERSKAEARLAEIEILYRDRKSQESDLVRSRELDDNYRSDRRRIEDRLERKLRQLRGEG